MITQNELLCHVAAYEANPPRTVELEQEIEIGSGFHGKWYRSQREHWLGWLSLKIRDSSMVNPGAEVPARLVWNRLKCSPMMFWLAETAGADSETLIRAADAAGQAAKINPKDGNPHGKIMRQVLPWSLVEGLLRSGPPLASEEVAKQAGDEALDRLLKLRPEFKT